MSLFVKNSVILFTYVCVSLTSLCQKIDTIIVTKGYTSYFSDSLKQPVFVVEKLCYNHSFCGRGGMDFSEMGGVKCASDKDYRKSGYDRGHLAPAEDFSVDCSLMLSTFSYINCFPQTTLLNRGKWAQLESEVRDMSRTDTLVVITGGCEWSGKVGSVAIPNKCWKIIINQRSQEIMQITVMSNSTDVVKAVDLRTYAIFKKITGIDVLELDELVNK